MTKILATARNACKAQNQVPKGFTLLRHDSPSDSHFDDARSWADAVQAALAAAGLVKPSQRISDCALELFFEMRPHPETGEIKHKLASARFCHFRHCPVCQQRRSMKNKARFLAAVPKIEKQHPLARWLMLTLTVKNCDLNELRATISAMNQAWNRLMLRSEIKIVSGWVRAVEVTRGKNGSAHPHFHVLMMVPPSYFSGHSYMPKEQWSEIWKNAMRLDYSPVVDVRAIRPRMVKDDASGAMVQSKSALHAAASEVLKYATKATDMVDDPRWLAGYIAQVHALKFLTSGGALKGIFKDKETEDLVHVDDDAPDAVQESVGMRRYDYMQTMQRYARKAGGSKGA